MARARDEFHDLAKGADKARALRKLGFKGDERVSLTRRGGGNEFAKLAGTARRARPFELIEHTREALRRPKDRCEAATEALDRDVERLLKTVTAALDRAREVSRVG